jgi:hypothetical protein
MKTPTKAELYAQVVALEKENIRLQAELDAQKQRYWLEHRGEAKRVFYESVPFTVLQIRSLVLDHVDSTGYWFTFNVDLDETKQAYCVRHSDIELFFYEINEGVREL